MIDHCRRVNKWDIFDHVLAEVGRLYDLVEYVDAAVEEVYRGACVVVHRICLRK